jgi:dihydroorotate dehydrogenase
MYKGFLRPILFLLKPETVHHLVVGGIKFLFFLPFVKSVFKSVFSIDDKSLRKEVFGLTFENPVGLAAGFDKNASFYNQFGAFGFSFIEIGTVTPVGQSGNPKPRSFRLPEDKALINRMGFNNNGVDKVVERLRKRKTRIVIGGNIGKNTSTDNEDAIDDYARCFTDLYDYVDYLVINVSCPNISDLSHLQDREQLKGILERLSSLRAGMTPIKPLLVKISPDLNFQQIDDVIDLIGEYGLDGIVATNTTVTRNYLQTDKIIVEKIGNGGLSGKPITNRSTEIIRYIHNKTNGKLPIIGVGGIMSVRDALEKLEAGASLIQIYTGFIYEGPALVKRINKALVRR